MVVCLFTSTGVKSVAKISHRQRRRVNRYRLMISQVAQKPGNTTSLRQIKIFLVKVSGLRKLSITRLANGVSVSKLIPIFKHRWLHEKGNHREFGSGARQPEISVVPDGCGAQNKIRGGSKLGASWTTLSLPSVVNGNPPDSGILGRWVLPCFPKSEPVLFPVGRECVRMSGASRCTCLRLHHRSEPRNLVPMLDGSTCTHIRLLTQLRGVRYQRPMLSRIQI